MMWKTGNITYIGDYSRKVTDWNRYPATMDVREFYGGDLKGVWDKLDYLQDLGVEVLYFNQFLYLLPITNMTFRIMITLILIME